MARGVHGSADGSGTLDLGLRRTPRTLRWARGELIRMLPTPPSCAPLTALCACQRPSPARMSQAEPQAATRRARRPRPAGPELVMRARRQSPWNGRMIDSSSRPCNISRAIGVSDGSQRSLARAPRPAAPCQNHSSLGLWNCGFGGGQGRGRTADLRFSGGDGAQSPVHQGAPAPCGSTLTWMSKSGAMLGATPRGFRRKQANAGHRASCP